MSRPAELVPAADHPAEAVRMLTEFSAELRGPDAAWMRAVIEERLLLARGRALPGCLWIGPGDEAVAIADWMPPADAGRRVTLYLAPGYRTQGALAALINALDRTGAVTGVNEPLPGFSESEIADALRPLGFRRIRRVDMVYPVQKTLPPLLAPAAPVEVRPLGTADLEAVARLLDRAYVDNPVDRAMFRQRVDPAEDARALVADLFEDRVGAWVPSASFAAWVGPTAVAATIVTDLKGPLVAEVMVDPDWRRRGLARDLLARSLGALRTLEAAEPRLVVTIENAGAAKLYESVGFVRLPETEGGLWLRLP
jgi:GNAT superfamily N-acetyltransferase